jgi:hypothetical protein
MIATLAIMAMGLLTVFLIRHLLYSSHFWPAYFSTGLIICGIANPAKV